MRRLLVAVGLVLAIPAGLLLAGLAALQIPGVQRVAAGALAEAASSPGQRVILSGLKVGWGLDLGADHVAIADAAGIWLSASGLRLDWSPMRLADGQLAIRRLAAEEVRVLRRPQQADAAAPTSGPSGLPSLPFAIRIDTLATRLDLAEALVGRDVSLDVAGQGEWIPGKVALVLKAEQMGGGASLDADLRYSEAEGRLRVDAGFDERASQVIAALIGVHGLPPVATHLRGDGPLANWHGRLVAASSTQTCLAADFKLARGVALELAAKGDIGAGCLDSAAFRGLAPDGVAFDVDMAWTETNRLHVYGGWISAAVGSLSFGGAIVDGKAEDFRYQLEVSELSRIGKLAGVEMTGRVALTGAVNGPLTAPVLQSRVASAAGSVAGVDWEGFDGGITIEPRGAAGWFVASDGRLILNPPRALPRLGEAFWRFGVAVNPADGTVRLASLQVDSHAARISALGVLNGWGRDVHLHVGLRGEELEPLLAPAGLHAAGRADVQLAVTGDLHAGNLLLVGGGAATRLTTGVARLDTLLGPRPRLWLSAGLAGRVIPFSARLAGTQASVAAGGLAGNLNTVGVRLQLPDLRRTVAVSGMQGQASALALLAGGAGGMTFTGALEAPGLQVGGLGPLRTRAVAGVADLLSDPRVHLAVTAAGRGIDANARAVVAIGDVVAVHELQVAAGPDRLSGDITYRPASGLLAGDIQARVEELGRWSKLAGMPLGGAVAATLRLRPGPSGQEAEGTVDARRLEVAGSTVEQARMTAQLAALFTRPAGRLAVDGSGVSALGSHFTTVGIRVGGALDAVEFTVNAKGSDEQAAAIAAGGQVSRTGAEGRLRLQSLDVAYGGQRARLRGASEFAWGPSGMELAPTVLVLGTGEAQLAGSLKGGDVSGRVKLSDVPAELAGLVLQRQDLAGTLSGDATIAGRLPAPEVTLSLAGRQLGIRQAASAPRLDAEMHAEWKGERAQVSLRAVSGGRVAAQGNGSFPLFVAPEGGIVLPEAGQIDGKIDLDADLARVAEVLPLAGQRIGGMLRANLAVAGTVGQPEVTGTGRVSNGLYENYALGTSLRDIAATITARDPRSFEVVGQASDGRAGRLSMQGDVTLDASGVAYTVRTKVSKFRAVALDAVTAEAGGDLRLEGRNGNAGLTGTLAVERGEVDIARALPPRVVTLDVVEINRPSGPARQEARKKRQAGEEGPVTLALSVAVDVQRLFVRGRGLDSEWKGALVAGGTASAPQVVGDLQAVRGRYDFLGREFRITDGKITFEGGDRINPALNIVAEAKANEITARVNVEGDALEPKIAFSSDPPYPSDEILSRLLFGKEAGQLTVGQQVQLARAAASLAGGGGGFDPVGNIRGALGLDVLDVGAGEEEGRIGPTVSAGKYIDENTFLRLDQGTKGSSVSIERELGHGLSVETQVGQQTGSGIGLNWRKDY